MNVNSIRKNLLFYFIKMQLFMRRIYTVEQNQMHLPLSGLLLIVRSRIHVLEVRRGPNNPIVNLAIQINEAPVSRTSVWTMNMR